MMKRTTLAIVFLSMFGMSVHADAQAGAPSNDAPATKAAPPVVELLEAGKAPRQVLRYEPKVGSKHVMVLESGMELETLVGGERQPLMDIPTTVMTVSFVIDSVADDGVIRCTFTVDDCTMVDDSGKELAIPGQESLKEIKGTQGVLVLSARGQVLESTVTKVKGGDQAIAGLMSTFDQSLQQLMMPFPEEPVGAGARWRMKRTVTPNQIQVEETVTARLSAVRDIMYSIWIEVEQTAPKQTLPPMRPGGPPMKILSFKGSTTGMMITSPSRPIPTRANIKSQIESTMEVTIGDVEQQFISTVKGYAVVTDGKKKTRGS